ncbi:hypothetical protein AJ80_07447 [Polytolypa hystricis UAMH7299]|uniref:FAD-binding PCMH-type domain-containing protein n=1 Tax=Polytolypa hystricis (strain UAMH7299) TaxID=1447883 RepID=A0A2B7XPI5_POLH7|nr:hypothetical protein AJ80_07447 [Polytolypa hystricis UAMH7299]
MHLSNFALLLETFTCLVSAGPSRRRRCAYGDSCWPDDYKWKAFNSSISGRLVRTYPSAAVCHKERYDAELCHTAKENWANSFWKTNQTGAYTSTLWELGEKGQCFIDSPRDAPCDQGIVPHYSVAAREIKDIQAAVKFADRNDLYLVVKNTGHDHLGRSSGEGSFSIWTHNLKGKKFHKSFVPKDAPRRTCGIPAVTLQAGEQWKDVYEAAAEQGVIVVGGHARTVGAAGGYLTGGGHSPFAHYYGLAVDNLLEVNLVDAKGNSRTLNRFTDPEYFYAIRGGGGSAWGVLTSVTYKTHPNPSHIQVGLAQFNTTDDSTCRTVLEASLRALAQVTEAGYTGYGVLGRGDNSDPTFQAIFFQPNTTNETFGGAFQPFFDITSLPGVSGQVMNFDFPSFIDYTRAFLADPNIATNNVDASRLLTADVLTKRPDKIVDLLFDNPAYGAGFNFIGKVDAKERDNTAVHPIWKESRAVFSMSADWKDDAPLDVKRRMKQDLVRISERLGELVGEDGGTYVNEANPYEPDWENTFWGSKYKRLLRIKRRIDPTNLFICNRCVGTDIVLQP